MSSEQLLLVMTAVLAVVALIAAFIAVRAARRLRPAPETPETPESAPANQIVRADRLPTTPTEQPESAVARIVEGRVIVPPTSRQIVDVTMSRPLVRVSVLSHGLAHALRPESRDRIIALMRREFQSRRRQRKRAARQAARLEPPGPQRAINRATAATEAWLGELPAPRHAAPYDRSAES
ncbi:MAG: hypothetical protein M3Q98_13125 [Actinomycetota bacterium]|nr:hypothetical protein [Actinomycetota bacterium]